MGKHYLRASNLKDPGPMDRALKRHKRPAQLALYQQSPSFLAQGNLILMI